MDLHDFYNKISEAVFDRTLHLSVDLAEQSLLSLLLALDIREISECTISLLADKVQIDGKSQLTNWNLGHHFNIRILCSQQKNDNNQDKIVFEASIWSDFSGTLQDFFGNVYSTSMVNKDNGASSFGDAIADIVISNPVISFVTGDEYKTLPLKFSAKTQKPTQSPWSDYDYILQGITSLKGRLNKSGYFKLEVPLLSKISGVFNFVNMSLLLINGERNDSDIWHSKKSVAGLLVRLQMEKLNTVEFTIPLFLNDKDWSLTAQFPSGLGIVDVANFMLSLFGIGGNYQDLCLPADTALNQFKLYRIGILASRNNLNLKPYYLEVDFALAKPWKLPIPYVEINKLYIEFVLTKGYSETIQDILTAHAGGKILVTLGSYKLSLSLDMELPSREFSAELELYKQAENKDVPNLQDLSKGMGVKLPNNFTTQYNQLGNLTIWGSMDARSFAIQGEIYDLISFNIGNLPFNLDCLTVEADVETSQFSFGISGLMTFGEGENSFSISLSANYQNPGWVFLGMLSKGTVDIGNLLSLMFKMPNPAQDICSLKLSELNVRYETESTLFTLTAAFEAEWKIKILGKNLVLGGRIQVWQQKEQDFDVSALAYINLGNFLILVQVDHVQNADSNDINNISTPQISNATTGQTIISSNENQRSYLFRLQYKDAYLQAAWFKRRREDESYDEILSVSLGGFSLGQLMEALVNMINPNKRYHLPTPWNVLNKIELSKFILELNVTQNQATFLYKADLNILGLLYLENIGILYDMNQRRLYFVLTGTLLGNHYGPENPIKWDAIDEKPPANTAENEQVFNLHYLGLGQHLQINGIEQVDSISDAITVLSQQLSPEKLSQGLTFDTDSNWVFGANFTINNMVQLQLVLNDPYLYGLLVTVQGKKGSALASFDGLGIELMCKKVSETVYMFRGELLMPKKYRTFQLGAVSLTLGTIRVEVYTNGGFYVDLGFPYNLDFSRSFVLEWGIFTGRGGIYLGVTKEVETTHLPVITNGNFSPIISLGIGLSVGIGRSFDLGIVKGGMSAEIFGLFEGVLAIFHPSQSDNESVYYYVQAVAGVTGQLYLAVDFKVVSIQASAQIQAAAMLTIQAYKATVIALDLSLKLGAKIKILFIKINFSFSFHQNVKFTFGQDSQAPWIEEKQQNLPKQLRHISKLNLVAKAISPKNIQLSIVPMPYCANPRVNNMGQETYGVAFLLMMDQHTQSQWTSLLAEWSLLIINTQANTQEDAYITVHDIEQLTQNLADTLTYQVLEEFLSQNTQITYDIHWVQTEQRLRESNSEEMEGFVFPMLPGLAITFATPDSQTTINYNDMPVVDAAYFDFLTEYFEQLNPVKNEIEPIQQNLSNEQLSINKAFFLDYFQMFLREVIDRLNQPFTNFTTDGNQGVITCSELYGISVTEILKQNPDLQLNAPQSLTLPVVQWLTLQSDTLNHIASLFGLNIESKDQNDEQAHIGAITKQMDLWNSLKDETFLLDNAATLQYGAGQLNNATKLTLTQAAAFIFVRFYEEIIPDQQFYVSDLISLNPNIDINWQETRVYQDSTQNNHEGNSTANSFVTLQLPEGLGTYIALRGDNLERIAKYVYILKLTESSSVSNNLPEWWDFYTNICKLNPEPTEETLATILFNVSHISLARDLSLSDLAMRIYPDKTDNQLIDTALWSQPILRCNVPIKIPNVIYNVDDNTSITISDIMQSIPCTVEELASAIKDDTTLCNAQLNLQGITKIPQQELIDLVASSATEIGSMISRILLQGLSIPEPVQTGNVLIANTEQSDVKIKPLFDVLSQMIPLNQIEVDYTLKVETNDAYKAWIKTDIQSIDMLWRDIAKRLPSGEVLSQVTPWQMMDAFAFMPQSFTLTDGIVCHCPDGRKGYIYSFSETIQRIIKQKVESNLEQDQASQQKILNYCSLPDLVNEEGIVQVISWGCLLPINIAKSNVSGMFIVYGIDAMKRLVLHDLLKNLDAEQTLSIHVMYKASALSKGNQDFWEYQWLKQKSFLIKTNLSTETHMGVRALREDKENNNPMRYIAGFDQPKQVLRMLWECSTIGGGGYYLQLKTSDGQTLPDDIFNDDGIANIWVLVQGVNGTIPREAINSCMLESIPKDDAVLTMVTTDSKQQLKHAVFPAGCIGLSTQQDIPQESDSKEEYMHSLFQITGYKILAGNGYNESNCSTPIMPEEEENVWKYHTVVPIYRYWGEYDQEQANPYHIVGQKVDIALEQRDILGNSIQIGTTSITPLYNDELIGVGQYPATKVTYALVKSNENEHPVLQLTFEPMLPDSPSSEMISMQRKAAIQLAAKGISISILSTINNQEFILDKVASNVYTSTQDKSQISLINQDIDLESNYLEKIIEYVNQLADALEGKGNLPNSLELNFELDITNYPLPSNIFKLETTITINRSQEFVFSDTPLASSASTVIFPFVANDATNVAQDNNDQTYTEQNLVEFCNKARDAFPNLYLAQTADADSVLYGIFYGDTGLIKRLAVFPLKYEDEASEIFAPEFYALRPLNNGLISRTAYVRSIDSNKELSTDTQPVEFSDVDIEVWAKQFLRDVERLLEPENLQKAGASETSLNKLDELIATKDNLAQSIALQITPLRQHCQTVTEDIRQKMIDRLRISLTEGYATDVLASYGLIFETTDNNLYRLECSALHDMQGCEIVMGKAESKPSKEHAQNEDRQTITVCFSNDFQTQNQQLKTDLVFTELEYNIEKDSDGYESSSWLRLIEPIRAERLLKIQDSDLVSDIALPNPLRECPPSPMLDGHTCSIHMGNEEGNNLLRQLSQNGLNWNYTLNINYPYRLQDRFEIYVEFKPIQELCSLNQESDLFDLLAEYHLYGNQLINDIVNESGESTNYQKALSNFVQIAKDIASVWGKWLEVTHNATLSTYSQHRDNLYQPSVYSCVIDGTMSDNVIHFKATSTPEGAVFLASIGLAGQEPIVEGEPVAQANSRQTRQTANDKSKEGTLYNIKCTIKNLPIFACARATPFVKVIRNQNLLSGENCNLEVCEEFIYRTPEVSLQQLMVSGEYTEEYTVAVLTTTSLTLDVFKKAVHAIYQALGLQGFALDIETTVSYEYTLAAGLGLPHIELPITFMPSINSKEEAQWEQLLSDNLYKWYEDMQPLLNDSGLRFDIKIYKEGEHERLLHFSNLKVKFDIVTSS